MPASRQGPWWSFSTAGRIAFGPGCSRFLPEAVAGLGQRVLLCTDPNLVAAGLVEPLEAALRSAGHAQLLVYDQGEAEIGLTAAERCADECRGFGPDVVIGVGGGSNLDLAKVVAVRLRTDRPIQDWVRAGDVPPVTLPVVALPTTAGTGSEVTPVAVLTDEQRNAKVGLANRVLLPEVVLVDPLLTLSCPPSVTAHSGMDALSHAIEAYLAIDFADRPPSAFTAQEFVGKNPLSDPLAVRAIELIGSNLVRAYTDGYDIAAREAMALASLLAGLAFSAAGTAIVHALQYPLGAATKTPHGLGNALLMPSVMRFNLPVREREAAVVARALGASASGDDAAAASLLPDHLAALARRVGIAPGLAGIGVTSEDLPRMADAAAAIRRLTANNPRPAGQPELLGVLQDALNADSANRPRHRVTS